MHEKQSNFGWSQVVTLLSAASVLVGIGIAWEAIRSDVALSRQQSQMGIVQARKEAADVNKILEGSIIKREAMYEKMVRTDNDLAACVADIRRDIAVLGTKMENMTKRIDELLKNWGP